MSKDLEYAPLLDVYAPMLTDKQREAMELYYYCDSSLGEIAETLGASRQAVNDLIRRGNATLSELEARLGVLMRLRRIDEELTELSASLEAGASDDAFARLNAARDAVREWFGYSE